MYRLWLGLDSELFRNDINSPLAVAILEPIFDLLGLKGPLLMGSFSKNVNPVMGIWWIVRNLKGIIWLVIASVGSTCH